MYIFHLYRNIYVNSIHSCGAKQTQSLLKTITKLTHEFCVHVSSRTQYISHAIYIYIYVPASSICDLWIVICCLERTFPGYGIVFTFSQSCRNLVWFGLIGFCFKGNIIDTYNKYVSNQLIICKLSLSSFLREHRKFMNPFLNTE